MFLQFKLNVCQNESGGTWKGGAKPRSAPVSVVEEALHAQKEGGHDEAEADKGGADDELEAKRQADLAFFEARGGRLYGFRFRDALDDRSCAAGEMPSATDQRIGTGDGVATRFQLVKAYGDHQRRILKPVAGSVIVAVDSVTAEFSLDAATGEVTLDAAPAPGGVVTAGYRFDCPVRFDTDRLDITLEGFGAGTALRVPLVELTG